MSAVHQIWEQAFQLESSLRRLAMSAIDSDDRRSLAQLLAEERNKQSLSLQDLSVRSGVAKSHLWELEQGRKASSLSIRTAVRLADGLSVPALAICAAAMRSKP